MRTVLCYRQPVLLSDNGIPPSEPSSCTERRLRGDACRGVPLDCSVDLLGKVRSFWSAGPGASSVVQPSEIHSLSMPETFRPSYSCLGVRVGAVDLDLSQNSTESYWSKGALLIHVDSSNHGDQGPSPSCLSQRSFLGQLRFGGWNRILFPTNSSFYSVFTAANVH